MRKINTYTVHQCITCAAFRIRTRKLMPRLHARGIWRALLAGNLAHDFASCLSFPSDWLWGLLTPFHGQTNEVSELKPNPCIVYEAAEWMTITGNTYLSLQADWTLAIDLIVVCIMSWLWSTYRHCSVPCHVSSTSYWHQLIHGSLGLHSCHWITDSVRYDS